MLARKAVIVTILQFGTLLAHLVFGLLLAYLFGASEELDSYLVAANFILFMGMFFAQSQARTFLPFISRFPEPESQKKAIQTIAMFNLILLAATTVLLLVFSPFLAGILAPGLGENQISQVASVLRILSTFIGLSALVGIGKGLLDKDMHVEYVGAMELLQSCIPIFGIWFLTRRIGIGGVAISNLSAIMVTTTIYAYYFVKKGLRPSFGYHPLGEELRGYYKLMAPMLLSYVLLWVIRYADIFIASFLDKGSISHLSYCQRIQKYSGFVSVGVSATLFPVLSKLQDKSQNVEFAKVLSRGISATYFVALPTAAFITLAAPQIVSILFERGEFTAFDTMVVGGALRWYALVLLCGPMGTFYITAYYSRGRTSRAMVISLISSLTNIVLNPLLGFRFGVKGLAAASSAAFLVGNVLQLGWLSKTCEEVRYLGVFSNFGKATMGALLGGLSLFLLRQVIRADKPIQDFAVEVSLLMLEGAVFTLVYWFSGFFSGMYEARLLTKKMLSLLRRS